MCGAAVFCIKENMLSLSVFPCASAKLLCVHQGSECSTLSHLFYRRQSTRCWRLISSVRFHKNTWNHQSDEGHPGKAKKALNVLVTGATGNVGSVVVAELLKRGAEVRALIRKPDADNKLPAGVEAAIGDLLDPVSIEEAMKGVDKLFLLNAVVADELTQALIAYGIAKRIGLKHVTYLSVFKVQEFRDVPHFASKLAVEGALREFGVPYTILRPGYYMQNDIGLKDALTGPGVYPMPLGTAGIAAADMRDIAEAAAISLTEEGHEEQTYDIVAPSLISGPGNAAL